MDKLFLSLLVILIIGGFVLGNAVAVNFNESIVVDAGGPTSVIIKAQTGQPNILFSDVGSRIYNFAIIDGTGVFTIGDVTAGKARLAVASNGNVGIGHINPVEALDVKGNIKLTGNIVSPNNICIGTCP